MFSEGLRHSVVCFVVVLILKEVDLLVVFESFYLGVWDFGSLRLC